MNAKSFFTSLFVYLAFIAVFGGIAYYSWRYFRKSSETNNTALNAPSIQNDANTTPEAPAVTLPGNPSDSAGITGGVNAPKAPIKPKVAGVTTTPTSQTATVSNEPDEDPKLTLSKPSVDYIDDDYVAYKYTFKLNQAAYEELESGMRYKIEEDSCEEYFDEDEEVFDREWDTVGTTITFEFELPEEVLDDDREDDDYMKKTSYTIYDEDNDVKFTGTTWAPVCND